MADLEPSVPLAVNVIDVAPGLDAAEQMLLYGAALQRIAGGVYDPSLVAKQALAAAEKHGWSRPPERPIG
jgi:hypothetical protein